MESFQNAASCERPRCSQSSGHCGQSMLFEEQPQLGASVYGRCHRWYLSFQPQARPGFNNNNPQLQICSVRKSETALQDRTVLSGRSFILLILHLFHLFGRPNIVANLSANSRSLLPRYNLLLFASWIERREISHPPAPLNFMELLFWLLAFLAMPTVQGYDIKTY